VSFRDGGVEGGEGQAEEKNGQGGQKEGLLKDVWVQISKKIKKGHLARGEGKSQLLTKDQFFWTRNGRREEKLHEQGAGKIGIKTKKKSPPVPGVQNLFGGRSNCLLGDKGRKVGSLSGKGKRKS